MSHERNDIDPPHDNLKEKCVDWAYDLNDESVLVEALQRGLLTYGLVDELREKLIDDEYWAQKQ